MANLRAAPPIGSVEWIEHVFSAPPVDRIKGRSKWTQTHDAWSPSLQRFAPVQGRPEFVGFLLLEYLRARGLLGRIKEHAFATTEEEFGWEIRPDLFAEVVNSRPMVIEVKTARFVTAAVELELNANRKAFDRFGLDYIVWTDRQPLSYHVRHNLINMNRSSGENIALNELMRVRDVVAEAKDCRLDDLVDQGFDLDAVFAAAWKGLIYFPIAKAVIGATPLSVQPLDNFRAMFLRLPSTEDTWWGRLQSA